MGILLNDIDKLNAWVVYSTNARDMHSSYDKILGFIFTRGFLSRRYTVVKLDKNEQYYKQEDVVNNSESLGIVQVAKDKFTLSSQPKIIDGFELEEEHAEMLASPDRETVLLGMDIVIIQLKEILNGGLESV